MDHILRTNSDNTDFQLLVRELDRDLAIRDGDEHAFYAQYNKIDSIRHAVVLFKDNVAVGCGAFKAYEDQTVEIKRMYVVPEKRGLGLAGAILKELEIWAAELGYHRAILETGKKQPEAIRLYSKSDYRIIPNFGPYAEIENSVCFEKEIT